MWKNGSTASMTSSSLEVEFRARPADVGDQIRCVSITPFGRPVVPLEYGRATKGVMLTHFNLVANILQW